MSSPDNTTICFVWTPRKSSAFCYDYGKRYTHYVFVQIWRSTVWFRFGPRRLVPNSCLQAMVDSA